MIFNGVIFPKKLIDALDQNNLVVFAGAGVSMGPPANLPSFKDLAIFLAAGTGRQIEHPLDRFIGTLPHDQQALRKKTAIKISEANNHNALHHDLLRVFKSPELVKIVTTNFDLLFESAAQNLWGTSTNIFTAPALPLGSKFDGIVHIHGSTNCSENIVLTDRDFGKAYLTEGWARRFLVSLFEHYTVVFVGYSYEDTVLQYLARALPDKAKGKRFSFVSELDSAQKWNSLGIEQLIYHQENPNDFSALPAAINELADFSNRSSSHWKSLISDIACIPPSNIDLSDEATIRHALNDLTKLRFFCGSATSVEWFAWLEKEHVLDDLFKTDQLDKRSVELASWVLQTIIENQSDKLIQLIGKHQFRIGNDFWHRLCHKVSTLSDPIIFSKWLDVLFQSEPAHVNIHVLQFLAKRSFELNLHARVVDIFERMATSKLIIRDPIPSESREPEIRGEIQIESPEWNLNQVWEVYIKPNLNFSYQQILNSGVMLLTKRNDLRLLWGGTYENFDLDSYSRDAIRSTEDDDFRNAIDVLIDATRDSLEKFAEFEPIEATAWVSKHQSSSHTILKRIAIHGISFISIPVDEQAKLLADFDIFNQVWRCEALDFINNNYVKISNATRSMLINFVKNLKIESEYEPALSTAREQLFWLNSFKSSDKQCALVDAAISSILHQHKDLNEDQFSEVHLRQQPEWIEHVSPWTVERLLSEHSNEWFESINSFKGSGALREPNRLGLLQSISDAVNQNKEWLTKLAEFLIRSDKWSSDIWPAILNVLVSWPGDKQDAAGHLSILSQRELAYNFPRNTAEILVGAVRNAGVPYIGAILQQTNEVAIYLWEVLKPSKNPINQENADWIFSAINTAEGTIAEYWISALDAANNTEEKSLIEPYRSALTDLCKPSDVRTVFTIPVVTQQLTFLTHLDQAWAIETIFPLFNPINTRVSHAWHGFLASRGPSEKVFQLMKNDFIGSIDKIDIIFGRKKNRFLEFYASATLWQSENPTNDWLPTLLTRISVEDRCTFTRLLGSQLKSIPPEKIKTLWNAWLANYWQDRIAASPVPLSEKEQSAMFSWLPAFRENFSDALSLAVEMQSPDLTNYHFLHEIKTENFIQQWPDEVVKLVIYFLYREPNELLAYNLEGLLEQIKNSAASERVLADLDEALLSAGRPTEKF